MDEFPETKRRLETWAPPYPRPVWTGNRIGSAVHLDEIPVEMTPERWAEIKERLMPRRHTDWPCIVCVGTISLVLIAGAIFVWLVATDGPVWAQIVSVSALPIITIVGFFVMLASEEW